MKSYIRIHSEKISRKEYSKRYSLSAYAIAKALNIPHTHIERIVAKNSTPEHSMQL